MGKIVIYLRCHVIFLSTALALLSTVVKAQQHTSDSVWRKGSVTLNSGEVIRGNVVFHHEILMANTSLAWIQGVQYKQQNYTSYRVIFNAVLLLDDGNRQKYYHGNDIKAFYMVQNPLKPDSLLQYTTLPMPSPRINNTRFFFEVIADGQVSLLKRVSVIYQDTSKLQEISKGRPKKEGLIAANYYVLNQPSNDFVLVKKNKKSLLKIMQNKKAIIKAFIKHEGLKLSQDIDLHRLFTYYNSLHTNPD